MEALRKNSELVGLEYIYIYIEKVKKGTLWTTMVSNVCLSPNYCSLGNIHVSALLLRSFFETDVNTLSQADFSSFYYGCFQYYH